MAHNIERLSAAQLASLLHPSQSINQSNDQSTNQSNPRVLVVDVRDDDFVGGNIPKAFNVPSMGFDQSLPMIEKRAIDENADLIVFHCMQSRIRGPKAARKFFEHLTANQAITQSISAGTVPKVAILEDGFEGWIDYLSNQRQAGEKVTHLVESYDRRAWQVKLD